MTPSGMQHGDILPDVDANLEWHAYHGQPLEELQPCSWCGEPILDPGTIIVGDPERCTELDEVLTKLAVIHQGQCKLEVLGCRT